VRISKKKYRGWHLGAISIDNDMFTVDLVRHHIRSPAGVGPMNERGRAKIIFTSVKKIILAKIGGGAEIGDIKQQRDDNGNIVCTLECSGDAVIEITSEGLSDLVL